MTYRPGPTEIEWLADLKPYAEKIGEEVIGSPVRWRVETSIAARRNRSDVRVETESGTLLFTGEAKRPDEPLGAHPLVESEVVDALTKAQRQGGSFCFTTNFHFCALFDAGSTAPMEPFARLQGGVIPLIAEAAAKSDGWWLSLSNADRERLVGAGLRQLFERYRLSTQGITPPTPIDEIALGFFSALTSALLEPLHRAFLAQPTYSPGLQERARDAGLSLLDDQDRRYLVAQGIAEVLSAALFHRLLRDYFSSMTSLLRGLTPSRSDVLSNVLTQSFDDARRESGDYEPILVLSPIARWVLENAPDQTLRHWLSLLSFVDRLDVASLAEDVLGSIFERLNSPERRHDMGQHYTQPRLARLMAQWGTTSPDMRILDPACGAGTFLVETYALQRELGLSHDQVLDRTFGNDKDSFAVHLASINLATRQIRRGLNHPAIRHGDAFDLASGVPMLVVDPNIHKNLEAPDLLITNPPYSRSHENESSALTKLQSLMAPRGERPPTMNGANWNAPGRSYRASSASHEPIWRRSALSARYASRAMYRLRQRMISRFERPSAVRRAA